MKRLINKIRVEMLKKNKDYDYYTITENGKITAYHFYKVA